MRKFLIPTFALVLIGAALALSFYYKNLRGIGPALQNHREDIAKVLNTTRMPLKMPEGFSISIFAKDLGDPRVIAFDPAGNLVVSIPGQGRVVALPDRDKDGTADEVITIAEGLNRPHGLAIRCTEKCQFYVAESNKVVVYDYEYDELKKFHFPKNGKKIVDLPSGGNHFSRTILFMPEQNDHKLLISVGSSCNVCVEKDDRRAKILIANADGSALKEFARGLRNAVFMAIHPETKEIWATEMGRDLLGDDIPPDEINIISEGKNYGWPICYGKNIHDGVFDKNTYIRNPCMEPFETPSRIDIPAHSAPLGLAFFTKEWGDLSGDLLVAYHGSWNRSIPTGYKIVKYHFGRNGGAAEAEDFITGWLQGSSTNGALGRPVDIAIRPDKKIYISDDKAGVIYRVSPIK